MASCEEDRFQYLHTRWVRGSRDLEQFKEEVGSWKSGRWTPDEIALLKRNVDTFMKVNSISNLKEFIFESKIGERASFYQTIARDIRRPIFPVYRKVLTLFNVNNFVGKWTCKQEKKLLRLHSTYGNKWSVIGKRMGMSGRAVIDKYRSMSKRKTKGPWSKEEEAKLISALKSVTNGDHLSLYDTQLPSTVTWDNIADLVGSRNAVQCRRKWILILSWQEHGGIKKWDIQDDVKLLRCLSSSSVDCEDEIDWAALCQGWEAARCSSYLRIKWSALRRIVPRYSVQLFQANLDYLLEHQLPTLERKLNADKT